MSEHGLPPTCVPLPMTSSRSPGTPGHSRSALLSLQWSLRLPLAPPPDLRRQPSGETVKSLRVAREAREPLCDS